MSGEFDYSVYVPSVTTPSWESWFYPTTTSNVTWSYPMTVYMYQVKCPKRGCKTMNWMQLDTITPCNGCGSKLKAVSEQADFEVAVSK